MENPFTRVCFRAVLRDVVDVMGERLHSRSAVATRAHSGLSEH